MVCPPYSKEVKAHCRKTKNKTTVKYQKNRARLEKKLTKTKKVPKSKPVSRNQLARNLVLGAGVNPNAPKAPPRPGGPVDVMMDTDMPDQKEFEKLSASEKRKLAKLLARKKRTAPSVRKKSKG